MNTYDPVPKTESIFRDATCFVDVKNRITTHPIDQTTDVCSES